MPPRSPAARLAAIRGWSRRRRRRRRARGTATDAAADRHMRRTSGSRRGAPATPIASVPDSTALRPACPADCAIPAAAPRRSMAGAICCHPERPAPPRLTQREWPARARRDRAGYGRVRTLSAHRGYAQTVRKGIKRARSSTASCDARARGFVANGSSMRAPRPGHSTGRTSIHDGSSLRHRA